MVNLKETYKTFSEEVCILRNVRNKRNVEFIKMHFLLHHQSKYLDEIRVSNYHLHFVKYRGLQRQALYLILELLQIFLFNLKLSVPWPYSSLHLRISIKTDASKVCCFNSPSHSQGVSFWSTIQVVGLYLGNVIIISIQFWPKFSQKGFAQWSHHHGGSEPVQHDD